MKDIVNHILELADQQIKIFLEDGKLKIDAPNSVVLEAVIPKIKLHKDELIKYLSGNNNGRPVVSIVKAAESESYALSSSQRRLWTLSQFEEGSIVYNMPGVFEFEGTLNIDALTRSFNDLIERHESLRTVFRESADGEIRQIVLLTLAFTINKHDLRRADEAMVKQHVQSGLSAPFDLANGPLLRADLYQSGDNTWIFSYVMHHIISDGWSMGILIKELLQLYNAFVQDQPNLLLPLRIHYKDYAVWQQEQLNEASFQQHRKYWLQQLSGALPVLNLPTDKPRPAIKTYNGASLYKQIDIGTIAGLKTLCESTGSTLFMGLLAAVKALLYRYTSQEDIIIGSPIAGREHSDLEDQIGFYVNTLVLRTQLNGADSYRQLLSRIKQTTLDGYTHQAYPFDTLIEELDLQRDLSRSALFDVMIVLQHQSSTLMVEKGLRGLQIRAYEVTQQGSKFDLEFSFVETSDQLGLYINYNTDLYHIDTIIRLSNHFVQLLVQIIAAPEKPIGALNYLSLAEQTQLLETFNNTNVPYALDKTVIDLIGEQVLRTPDATALVYEGKALIYRKLDETASQLAHYLKQTYDISTGDLVAIGLERSEWLPLAILGILKTGAAYIPVDTMYPQERIDYIIQDGNCKVFFDKAELEKFRYAQCNYDTTFSSVHTGPDDIAYCIYTSGSTGTPKGVLNTHGGIYNRLVWMKEYLNVSIHDVFLQKTPYTFDVSVWELLLPFISGSSLVVTVPEKHKDPVYLQDVIAEKGVTIAHFVPSMLGAFLVDVEENKCAGLKHIICSGEELPASMVVSCRNKLKDARIHNLYGPTEAAIDVTAIDVTDVDVAQCGISIGGPVANTKIYIVNDFLQLQPAGVAGELLISGSQVAKGYLHLEQLTASRFINDPFRSDSRVYHTGDLARWLPGGTIQYLGRMDNQVKIRGNRIELGEVEKIFSTFTAIEQAIVAVRKVNEEKVLVAYYTSAKPIDKIALRQYLQQKLPEYMVPSYYVALTEVPLTASGKVDRKALPIIKEEDVIHREYVAPRNVTEEKLVHLWHTILKRERIGVTDSFFELGGHSLKAISLLSIIHKEYGVSINLKTLFTHPTIRSLAEHIESSVFASSKFERIPGADTAPSYPVSNAQLRIWLESQSESASISYHIPFQVNLHGVYDVPCLQKAVVHIINRHEILRTVFRLNEDQELRQYILSTEALHLKMDYKDFNGVQDVQAQVRDYVTKDNHQLFDLEAGPLIRAAILKCTDEHYVFYCNLHHIICDAWSVPILKTEMLASYKAFSQNEPASLPELNIQYKDYTIWYLQQLNNNAFRQQQEYWLKQLNGELPLLNFPAKQARPPVKTYNGYILKTFISSDVTAQLKAYTSKNNGSLFMVILGTLHALLSRYTGAEDIIIGSPFTAREHIDLENQVGFYTNTLPLRNQLEAGDTFNTFFQKVRDVVLDAHANQQYPFDQLVKDLHLKKDTSRNPVFDVMLVVNNQQDAEISTAPADTDDIVAGTNKTSKFDMLVYVEEVGGLLSLRVEYNTDLFEPSLIRQFIRHYKTLVTQLLANPTKPIASINYLLPDEGIVTGEVHTAYSNEGVIAYFEQQVLQTPDKIAVQFLEQAFTYCEINEQANQLAHYLRNICKVSPQTNVGVILDRSQFNIIAMIGVVKSGACYVPVDHKYQEQRIKYILNDAAIEVVISVKDLFDHNVITAKNIIYLDAFDYPALNITNPASVNVLDDPSFIIYTSGSTGNPKGVIQTHRMLNNLIQWNIYHSGIDTGLKHLQYCSFSFDVSLQDCWFVLSGGGTLFITPEPMKTDFLLLTDYIIKNGIEVLCFPFTALTGFFNDVAPEFVESHQVRHIISSGEQLTVNKPLEDFLHQNPGVKLHNHYGPSETHVVTSYTMSKDESGIVSYVPIGKPLPNTFIYLLDKNLQPVPRKVIGEIYIGGDHVAAGYLNLPELTAQRFLVSPFNKQHILYKTGDMAFVDHNGNIIYLGRNDDQVKIRGYRIELAETKNALLAQEGITQAYVDVIKRNNEQSLVAYIVGHNIIDRRSVRKKLSAVLPDYMVPAHVVIVDVIPLTSNGKINKKALPAIDESKLVPAEYVAPRTDVEKRLTVIWKKVLGLEKIGITDDFFESGGHSLYVTRMLYEINRVFDIKLQIKAVFASHTVQELAQVIEDEIVFKNGVALSIAEPITAEKNSEIWEI